MLQIESDDERRRRRKKGLSERVRMQREKRRRRRRECEAREREQVRMECLICVKYLHVSTDEIEKLSFFLLLQRCRWRCVHGRMMIVIRGRRGNERGLRQLRGVVGVQRGWILGEALMQHERVDGERRVAREGVRIERHLIQFALFLFQLFARHDGRRRYLQMTRIRRVEAWLLGWRRCLLLHVHRSLLLLLLLLHENELFVTGFIRWRGERTSLSTSC